MNNVQLAIRAAFAINWERVETLGGAGKLTADQIADLRIMRRLDNDRLDGLSLWHHHYGLTP